MSQTRILHVRRRPEELASLIKTTIKIHQSSFSNSFFKSYKKHLWIYIFIQEIILCALGNLRGIFVTSVITTDSLKLYKFCARIQSCIYKAFKFRQHTVPEPFCKKSVDKKELFKIRSPSPLLSYLVKWAREFGLATKGPCRQRIRNQNFPFSSSRTQPIGIWKEANKILPFHTSIK